MKEQINKLALQARKHADSLLGKKLPDMVWQDEYNQKFAELIVRECVTKMALEVMNNSWIDDAVKNTYKHFGVEE